MPVEAASRASRWCEVRPEAAARLSDLGLRTARDFLALQGVVVSGHVGRNVSRVELGDQIGYLKREHTVRRRDRWRNLLGGFGPVSMSRREWSILQYLDVNDLPGPQWLACGEADGQAFLLLDAATDAVDLRRLNTIGFDVATQLGQVLARMHDAGVDQPDLFAKHFLIDPATGQFTVLDWQRAVRRGGVSWDQRIQALGTFRATCTADSLPDTAWDELLRAYLATIRSTAPADCGRRVAQAAVRAARRPAIRSQLVPPAVDQELVRIGGERVCVIPTIARELDQPEVLDSLYDLANDGRRFRFRNDRTGQLRVRRYPLPFGRWFQTVRGKAWRSPELQTARLLFHLERHGIPAPKLLAYGQTVTGVSAHAFVLDEPPDVDPITPADLPLAMTLLKRLHSAGCTFRPTGEMVGVFGKGRGEVVVVKADALRLNRNPSRRHLTRDQARLAAYFRTVS